MPVTQKAYIPAFWNVLKRLTESLLKSLLKHLSSFPQTPRKRLFLPVNKIDKVSDLFIPEAPFVTRVCLLEGVLYAVVVESFFQAQIVLEEGVLLAAG